MYSHLYFTLFGHYRFFSFCSCLTCLPSTLVMKIVPSCLGFYYKYSSVCIFHKSVSKHLVTTGSFSVAASLAFPL